MHIDDLFVAVQTSQLFADSKTFVDCRPKIHPELISQAYLIQKNDAGFNLATFIADHYYLPEVLDKNFTSNQDLRLEDHLCHHWPNLTRPADDAFPYSTLIALPNSYVVPGGRFREIYYWDSYFTMLGLLVSNRLDLVNNMMNNLSWLITEAGMVPNGNRTYYLSRSQPPFFGAMVKLYIKKCGIEPAMVYLPALEKEYLFWMNGQDKVSLGSPVYRRLVLMKEGAYLNRYYDDADTPRPESYIEDIEVSNELPEEQRTAFYRNIRAAAESGWDFSSRWMAEPPHLSSTETTNIVPIDLNCILYTTEMVLAQLWQANGQPDRMQYYQQAAESRKRAIHEFLWDAESEWFRDYNWFKKSLTSVVSVAAVTALYFEVATNDQAASMTARIEKEFLQEGGLVTTLAQTGQQWDYPNGWAPMQWMATKGLKKYYAPDLANTIAERWLNLNRKIFRATGRMMEKYNVVDTSLVAGGGEYALQDGFGWTNGVALALIYMHD